MGGHFSGNARTGWMARVHTAQVSSISSPMLRGIEVFPEPVPFPQIMRVAKASLPSVCLRPEDGVLHRRRRRMSVCLCPWWLCIHRWGFVVVSPLAAAAAQGSVCVCVCVRDVHGHSTYVWVGVGYGTGGPTYNQHKMFCASLSSTMGDARTRWRGRPSSRRSSLPNTPPPPTSLSKRLTIWFP